MAAERPNLRKLAIVVAIAENGVIGREGGLPWRLSSDLKRFKADTMGKPIIMGRKTWESIGRPLPGRISIVVTRDKSFRAEGAEVVNSFEDAVALARIRAQDLPDADEICIIGGGEIYRQALPLTDKLYVTHVLASVDGDTRFPEIDPEIWRMVRTFDVPVGKNDSLATRYTVYERRPTVH
ncbi:dihydrofolate reductase [Pseudaminobacter sp. NGMCC 1.201702]|uniref:dihydrofolate reductase n=1 Tax=Pseudaminobacter sp. NGMCC 1.201702 TaxID=3391825 RepID=UPI0039F0AACC